MLNLNDLKPGDRLVAAEGHPSFAPGQELEVVRVRRGDVLVPGTAEDGSDAILAATDALVVMGGRLGPCILAVRSDGGTGRRWVRSSARHREDRRLREEDLTHPGFTRAGAGPALTAPSPSARTKARRAG
jgi:hypothetical protein